MKSIKVFTFMALLTLQLLMTNAHAQKFSNKKKYCESYITWLYSQTVEQSFENSQKLALIKFILLYRELTKHGRLEKMGVSQKIELELLGNEFKKNFPKLKNTIDLSQITYTGPIQQRDFSRLVIPQEHNLPYFINQMFKLQESYPENFNEIEQHFLINHWDILNQELNKEQRQGKIEMRISGIDELYHNFHNLYQESNKNISTLLKQSSRNYLKDCSHEQFIGHIRKWSPQCEDGFKEKSLSQINLGDLGLLFQSPELRNLIPSNGLIPPVLVEQPFWPLDPQKTLENADGPYYCKRSTDLLTTVIFHHTATPVDHSIDNMNKYMIKKHGMYMIAYHYVINGEQGDIAQGRQDWMKGAHAGSKSIIRDKDEYAHVEHLLDRRGLACGDDSQQKGLTPGLKHMEEELFLDKGDVPGANALSIGVAFSGDYDSPKEAHHPNSQAVDSAARLICNLQKKYPSIKTIGGHRQYALIETENYQYSKSKKCYEYQKEPTGKKIVAPYKSCPGDVMLKTMREVSARAESYGCKFSVNSFWIAPLCVSDKDLGR